MGRIQSLSDPIDLVIRMDGWQLILCHKSNSLKFLDARYTYDGNGRGCCTPEPRSGERGTLVRSVVNGITTYYPSASYQEEGGKITKYYSFGGQKVAQRQSTGGSSTLSWLISDHLGSTNVTANANGSLQSEMRYAPFGETRYTNGVTPSDYRYTGQLNQPELGLYYYVARWYDPQLGRFIQADTVVPDPGDAKAFDRYSYVINNPINLNDPSGHCYNFTSSACIAYWQAMTTYAYHVTIETEYTWQIEASSWKNFELQNIYQAGKDIKNYVDNLTGGKGQDWIQRYLGGTKIDHAANNPLIRFPGDGTSMGLPGWATRDGKNSIYLAAADDPSHIVHELGHIWDANTGENGGIRGVVGGVADSLNNFIRGDTTAIFPTIRYINFSGKWASSMIPENFRYPDVDRNPNYANGSTADYLAQSFRFSIYNPSLIRSLSVKFFIQDQIKFESISIH